MLTNRFYNQLTRSIKDDSNWSNAFIAIGRGDVSWDRTSPFYDRELTALVDEVSRKQVARCGIYFVDEAGETTETVTSRLAFNVTFEADEGEGTFRECGLFVHEPDSDSEVLVSYFIYPRIEKNLEGSLSRQILLDLTPRSSGTGQIITRYLGNTNSRECHDLDNQQTNCQIAEISFDHRIYFGTPGLAQTAGYDYCAFCFGRELSER